MLHMNLCLQLTSKGDFNPALAVRNVYFPNTWMTRRSRQARESGNNHYYLRVGGEVLVGANADRVRHIGHLRTRMQRGAC